MPCGRPRPCPSSLAFPTGPTPWGATRDTACRGARSSGWPLPGCCSRLPTWWCSTTAGRSPVTSPVATAHPSMMWQ